MAKLINTNTGPTAVDNIEDDVTRGLSAAKLVLKMSEATMPGDIGHLANTGMGEGKTIWDRMCMLINARSLDLRILMDAHDRRNRGFVSVPTFRRSLCYAFGNQWIELGMSSKEFNEICGPYLSRRPGAPGDPEAYVMWQKFTDDVQTLAEKKIRTDGFLARLKAVEERETFNKILNQKYGITDYELKLAQTSLTDRLLQYSKTLAAAFRTLDKDKSGVLSRQEIRDYFAASSGYQQGGAQAFTENVNLGGVSDAAIECLLDFVDKDGDGDIPTAEMIAVLETEDIQSLAPGGVPGARQVKAPEQMVRGVPLSKIKFAARIIRERLIVNAKSISQAFKKVDADGSGLLSRDEILQMLNDYYILKYTDVYTKEVRGDLEVEQVHALLDLVDSDGDGGIKYLEFSRVLADGNNIDAIMNGGKKKKLPVDKALIR
uniref:EF-hand domain-containing protein n=1 Tax=Haptolina ericina TaxID=156174 RepID=A0A7S3B7N1_9EUKA